MKAVDGVTEVTWLDDAVDITLPISAIDKDILETYYADNTALLTVTIEEEKPDQCSVADIREIIGDENAMRPGAPFLRRRTH